MNSQNNQKEINTAVWQTCSAFRDLADSSQYKDYILAMLFLKRETAIWQNLYEHRTNAIIGELINAALSDLEKNNPRTLGNVFQQIDFTCETTLGKSLNRNRRLNKLLESFNDIMIDPKLIGDTFLYLLERFANDAKKTTEEFFTPPQLSALLTKLIAPKPGDSIYDPACGTGSLLVQAANQVASHNVTLFGQESNRSTWAICRMNMALNGMNHARIELGDTLTSPLLLEDNQLMKFNSVVSNPPMSLRRWNTEEINNDPYHRFWRGTPPTTNSDWAFISHMVESAFKKEGRIAVVVPHGVLFRGGVEGKIRQQMIEENLVDAVIGLPNNLLNNTAIPVAILVLDRSREKGGNKEACQDILFIDASRDFVASKNQNTLSDAHLAKIMKAYNARTSQPKHTHVAELAEVRKNEFNLNLPRYVNTFEEDGEDDIDTLQKEINQLQKELLEVRKRIDIMNRGMDLPGR